MKSGYAFSAKENMAKACARNIHVSTKHAIEICSYIRGKSLDSAKRMLQMSIDMKRPIPIKRFTNGPGHKSGMGSGRFHVKACEEILKALESAESNAKNKGLGSQLTLAHIAAQKAGKQSHYGRKRRSIFKSTHIEVVVEEAKKDQVKDQAKSRPKSQAKAQDNKVLNNKDQKVAQ